jgi:hypothetical protein
LSTLSLDFGNNTGWALEDDAGVITSGTVQISDVPIVPSERFSRFWMFLEEKGFGVNYLAYEHVNAETFKHKRSGKAQMEQHLGYRALALAFAGMYDIKVIPVPVQTAKKAFTGSGKAEKEDMMRAAKDLGHDPKDHNAADAIGVLKASKQLPSDAEARMVVKQRVSAKKARKKVATKKLPRLMILGMGRHGKDTTAEYLRDEYGFSHISCSLFVMEKAVLPAARRSKSMPDYATPEECYNDRHNHREFWFKAISKYNSRNKARLGTELFKTFDMCVGLRCRKEFEALRTKKAFDAVIWVDRSALLPPESEQSMTLKQSDADFVIDNNGTLADLHCDIDNLMRKAFKLKKIHGRA